MDVGSAPLPGFAVERHGEVFGKWRELIEAGRLQTPFHVTDVDAHGDLSMGEIGYKHILTELVRLPAEDRPAAAAAASGTGRGLPRLRDRLSLGERTRLRLNEGGGGDVHAYFWENFDKASSTIRLAALPRAT